MKNSKTELIDWLITAGFITGIIPALAAVVLIQILGAILL